MFTLRNEDLRKWVNTLTKWEKFLWGYLEFAELDIQRNENPTEDFPNKYWIVDTQNTWGPEPCEGGADVFEAHPSVVEEFLDDLYEESEEIEGFPEVVGDEIGYHGWEAGYWGWLFDHKEDADLSPEVKQFLNEHSWECEMCNLMAFHTEEVDLEKFI